jgi:hypothetical protein
MQGRGLLRREAGVVQCRGVLRLSRNRERVGTSTLDL